MECMVADLHRQHLRFKASSECASVEGVGVIRYAAVRCERAVPEISTRHPVEVPCRQFNATLRVGNRRSIHEWAMMAAGKRGEVGQVGQVKNKATAITHTTTVW